MVYSFSRTKFSLGRWNWMFSWIDEDKIRTLVEETRNLSVREMFNILNFLKLTLYDCLNKNGTDVGFESMGRNVIVSIDSLHIFTCTRQNWIVCKIFDYWRRKIDSHRNPRWKRNSKGEQSQQRVKPGLNYQGILYFELPSENITIYSDIYNQMDKLKETIAVKRGKEYENKLYEFWWESLQHPAYFPDIASFDHHLFRGSLHFSLGTKFDNINHFRNFFQEYLNKKRRTLHVNGIIILSRKREEVLERS